MFEWPEINILQDNQKTVIKNIVLAASKTGIAGALQHRVLFIYSKFVGSERY